MMQPWHEAIRPMRRIGHSIELHASIGSTNDRARTLLDEDGMDGGVVVAEEQTAGRGRRGRTWLSPPGLNLMVSVALRPMLPARDAWQLGLATALATASACRSHVPVDLKWPNDVVSTDGAKLAGLLIETMADGERLSGAVLGIGINVNWTRGEMPAEIASRATSLADLSGAPVDRVPLLRGLLEQLDLEIAFLEAGESPLERYRAVCTTLGAAVTVATPTGSVRGRAVDLDGTGALVVDADDGRRHVISSGEVVKVQLEVPA
jgi:BirA family transcriptional regulator, biotin operon repressor / biotin---[acetyl-CoA-carboxylase] ligase